MYQEAGCRIPILRDPERSYTKRGGEMYTESVSEIIDDLLFDERFPDRESMRQEGIRRLLKSNLGKASSGHKYYYKPDLTEKVMETARKYFDANAREEEILGFYDDTLFGKANEGTLHNRRSRSF